MTNTKPIAVNGRFLSTQMTGVHRVAEELLAALSNLPDAQHCQLRLIKPKNFNRSLDVPSIDEQVGGALTWQFWEQFDLPRLVHKDELLLNLCNLAPLSSRRSITMIHDAQVHISPGSYSLPFRKWYQYAQPRIGHRQARILTVSDFSRQQLVRFGIAPEENITVIHNGADHILRVDQAPDVIGKLGLEPGMFVCALASTQRHKNIQILLKAFSCPEMEHMKLLLVGGADRDAFEAEGHAVPENVVFAGRLSDAELRSTMEAALCFAFPSTTEGFGLPPLESMLLGTPALCAAKGAIPEVCKGYALYAAHDESSDWASKLLELATNETMRNTLSDAGQKHAEQFTWHSAATKLLDVIEDVTDGSLAT